MDDLIHARKQILCVFMPSDERNGWFCNTLHRTVHKCDVYPVYIIYIIYEFENVYYLPRDGVIPVR